ncbi:MAG: RIP metalloprotease RseP [Bdellovibrionota bacterium]
MYDFLSHPIPAVLFLLGILVFVHEFGHFIVGKLCGIGVEIFSIGFGPRIFGFRHNGTDYRISWIPLGGYVKFAGSMPSEDVPDRFIGKELYRASLLKRFFVISAGPFGNLLLAAVVYFILGTAGINHPSSVIGEVRPESPADRAGFMSGDQVIAIDDNKVEKWRDLQEIISKSAGKNLLVRILRDEKPIDLQVSPASVTQENMNGKKVQIGRVGIGYGFLPPLVSMLSKDSELAKQGMKTGDSIYSIEFNGNEYLIKSWAEFLAKLNQAYQDQVDSLKINWSTVPSENSGNSKDQPSETPQKIHSATILTTIWKTTEFNNEVQMLINAKAMNAFRKKLAESLFLSDAQLTISKASGTLDKTLKQNDRILEFSHTQVRDIYHLQELISENKEASVELLINRKDQELKLKIDLKPVEVQKPSGLEIVYVLPVSFIGASIEPDPVIEKYDNIFAASWYGIKQTVAHSGMLAASIWGLITGDVPLKALGGPMLIAKVAGDSAKLGWQAFLTSMALISINLGMINLFPIPVLDGGQLVIVGIEAVRRKRLSEAAIENYQKIGFVMVMSLVVLATYNDISRFWASMVKGVAGLF